MLDPGEIAQPAVHRRLIRKGLLLDEAGDMASLDGVRQGQKGEDVARPQTPVLAQGHDVARGLHALLGGENGGQGQGCGHGWFRRGSGRGIRPMMRQS